MTVAAPLPSIASGPPELHKRSPLAGPWTGSPVGTRTVARGEGDGCGLPGPAFRPAVVPSIEAAPLVPPPNTPSVPWSLTAVPQSSPAAPHGSVPRDRMAGESSSGVPSPGDPGGPAPSLPTARLSQAASLQLAGCEPYPAEVSHGFAEPAVPTSFAQALVPLVPLPTTDETQLLAVPTSFAQAHVPLEPHVPLVPLPTMDETQLLAVEELLPAWAEDGPQLLLQSHLESGLRGTGSVQGAPRDEAASHSPAGPGAPTSSPASRGAATAGPETPAIASERVPVGTARGPSASPQYKVIKDLITAIETAPGWRASPNLPALVNRALQQYQDPRDPKRLEKTLYEYGWSGTGFPDGTDFMKLANELRFMAYHIVADIGQGAYAKVYKVSC